MKTARVTGRRHRISGSPQFDFKPSEWPTFIHLDLFDEEWADLGLSDEDLRGLQDGILANPARYPVVRQAGGLRKNPFYTREGWPGQERCLSRGLRSIPGVGLHSADHSVEQE